MREIGPGVPCFAQDGEKEFIFAFEVVIQSALWRVGQFRNAMDEGAEVTSQREGL